jgi:hypothetical protein
LHLGLYIDIRSLRANPNMHAGLHRTAGQSVCHTKRLRAMATLADGVNLILYIKLLGWSKNIFTSKTQFVPAFSLFSFPTCGSHPALLLPLPHLRSLEVDCRGYTDPSPTIHRVGRGCCAHFPPRPSASLLQLLLLPRPAYAYSGAARINQ